METPLEKTNFSYGLEIVSELGMEACRTEGFVIRYMLINSYANPDNWTVRRGLCSRDR